ncbi:hypothetical protein [Pseudanabaena sp. BC1403]|uniref:hypothetical protein n=1 Tax=Pseudanabaena sp. BC1403 TaxID=2043171 RepID=UPI000CD93A93|nr:hypothetical protein [Pseudanabaena sp. BC1403]
MAETVPATLSAAQLRALERSLNGGSVPNSPQLRALERALNGGSVPYSPPPVPSDNGLLRQAPNIPNTKPSPAQAQNLIDTLNNQRIPTTQTAPIPNTPIPQVNTPPVPLTQRVNNALTSPISFPSADKVNNALNKAGGAVAAASVAISVGGSLANAVRNPDTNSLAQAAVASASGALLLAPNPYAKAAGLALSVLGQPLVNLIFPSANNLIPSPNLPLSGGQSIGIPYTLYLSYDVYQNGNPIFSVSRNGFAITAPFRGISAPYGSGTNWSISVQDGSGTRQIQLAAGTGGLTIIGFSPSIERTDGQPDTGDNPSGNTYINIVNNDGRPSALPFDFDPAAIGDAIDKLNALKDSVNGLSDDNKEILDRLKNLANPSVANPLQSAPVAPNLVPIPPIKPAEPKLGAPQGSSNETVKLPDNSKIMVTGVNTGKENDVSTPNILDKLKEQINQAKAAEQAQTKATPQTQQDRFKDPKDCQFSCENLAKCFVDLKVSIFDGCNPDTGVAKTKEITIQVLPKDKAKTEASFKELLDMRSRECDLSDRVQTTPEYWATRRGQIPQAIILYKTTTKGENGQPSYYQLQIPHYNGGKNGKPSLPTYQKGEHMAIYECIDGSQMQVYAISDAEALRVINACEKYINPRMRMKDKKNIKTGKRGGMEKVSVKPIRLDFSSIGQAKKSPDWSIPL